MSTEETKYLKIHQKIAYGFGDFGANCFYTFLTSFVLIYLTDAVGLNAGIVGTLILISKCFDGFTDVVFGKMIDKTHHRFGKARPWMIFTTIPIAVCEVLLFSTPIGMSQGMQYAYFFIIYTVSNSIFYTANNIAYSTLMALITKNEGERIQITSLRYMFAMIASVMISAISIGMVNAFGGGVAGWRMTSLVFAVIQTICCLFCCLSVKEIPEETSVQQVDANFFETLKAVLTNKYYILLLTNTILGYISTGIMGTLGVYYCSYVLGNSALLGVVSMAQLTLAIGLAFTPAIAKKNGNIQGNDSFLCDFSRFYNFSCNSRIYEINSSTGGSNSVEISYFCTIFGL